MTYSLGVDLGTTFVAAAVARPAGIAMVPLGDQSVVAPAVAAVRPDGSILTGDAAERRAVSQPALVARSVRRRLGEAEPVRLGDVSYPVATLLGAQLRDVVQRATEREGDAPERVVLAHPATWTPARRGRFDDVAQAAGVEAPVLVTAAEAAAHHAARVRSAGSGILAVYDLGGGGFEATVVRTGPEGPEILGNPEGIEGFGGADLDDAILSYVDDAMGGALARLDMDDARTAVALARLRQDCVLAKETLSQDTEVVVPVFLPGRHFEIRLNRTTFEQMLRSPVGSTVDALSRAVRSAGLSPADVDAVLLVGGSTRIPLVGEAVVRGFGRPLVEGVHPVHAVALGAAALAGVPALSPLSGGPADPARTAPWAAAADPVLSGAPERSPVAATTNGAALHDPEPGAVPTAAAEVPWFDAADARRAAVPVAEQPDPPTGVGLPRFGPVDADERNHDAPDVPPGFGPPQPQAWPPAGPVGFQPAPGAGFRPAEPPRPAAPQRRGAGSVALMAVGAVVAIAILVLVFLLAPQIAALVGAR